MVDQHALAQVDHTMIARAFGQWVAEEHQVAALRCCRFVPKVNAVVAHQFVAGGHADKFSAFNIAPLVTAWGASEDTATDVGHRVTRPQRCRYSRLLKVRELC